jgi:predicted nucleic acid-binding protein
MGALEQLLNRMTGKRVYFDSNFLIYFLERHEPQFSAVLPLIQACDAGLIQGVTGDAAVAEVMVLPYRNVNPIAIARTKSFFARKNFITVVQHDSACFASAAALRANTGMKLIDALHFATAAASGCRFLLTNDRAFKTHGDIEIVSLGMLTGGSEKQETPNP